MRLKLQRIQLLDGSKIAEAIDHSLSAWKALTMHLDDVAGKDMPCWELDSVHWHRWLPSGDMGQLMRPVAHQMSLSELCD